MNTAPSRTSGALESTTQHESVLAFALRLRKSLLTSFAVLCALFLALQAAAAWLSSVGRHQNEGIVTLTDRAGYQRSLMLLINQKLFDAVLGTTELDTILGLFVQADADARWLDTHLTRWELDQVTAQAWAEAQRQRGILRHAHGQLLARVRQRDNPLTDFQASSSGRELQQSTNAFVEAQGLAIKMLALDIQNDNRRFDALATLFNLLSIAIIFVSMIVVGRIVLKKLTEDQAILAAQSQTLDRLAILVERTDSMFVITDAQSKITYVNPPFERVTGYTLDELIGKVPGRVLQCEQTDPKARAAISAAIKEGRAVQATLVNKSKLGRLYWVHIQIEPIRDAVSGRLLGFTSLEQDVTRDRSRRQQLAGLLNAMPVAVLVVNDSGIVIDANPLATEWMGMRVGDRLSAQRQIGDGLYLEPDGKIIHPADLPISRVLRDAKATQSRQAIFQAIDGTIRDLKFEFQYVEVSLEKHKHLIVTTTDVTGLVHTQKVLQMAAQTADIGNWEANFQSGTCRLSALWWQRLEAPVRYSEVSLRAVLRGILPPHRRRVLQLMQQMQSHPELPAQVEVQLNLTARQPKWILLTGTVTSTDPSRRVRTALGIHQDITRRKLIEEDLRRESSTDSLTDMPNRRSFARALESHITAQSLTETIEPFALLFLDLDHFKDINDRLGHHRGDEVLQTVSARINEVLRTSDVTAARLGGDEFVVLATRLASFNDGDIIAHKLVDAVSRPMKVAEQIVEITCSIGIATPLESGYDAHALLRDADIALYAAKQSGRARHERFQISMRERVEADHTLAADIRRGLAAHEFINHYQPIVDTQTGRVVNIEALVRWSHPKRGLVYPSHFIDMAEATGSIAALGLAVLDRACADFCWLRDQLGSNAPSCVSVNLSRAQLVDTLPKYISDTLYKWGVSPDSVQLEITETLAMIHSDSRNILRDIRRLGVRLALDDFGTGYSSLSTLDTLPITSIKIDKSFVDDVETSAYRQAIVLATMQVANALGISTVAEGVETKAQQVILTNMGCNQLQGYLFSKPLSRPDLVTWLHARHQSEALSA